ncbi:MAG: hypothetical protein KJO26_07640 [Deltaproteobacteria bacterium]|nr:hypothetical protein [Deltaproteobacteria bacterium]
MAKPIELNYIRGLIPDSEIVSIRSYLKDHNIAFECHDLSGIPQAAVEDLLSHVVLFLSSSIMQAYVLGLATSATYDLIRNTIINIWKHVSGKEVHRISQKGAQAVPANLDLDIESAHGMRAKFKLQGNIPDSYKLQCVDKAFQLIETDSFPVNRTGYVCIYDTDQYNWKVYEYLDFVKRFVKPKE